MASEVRQTIDDIFHLACALAPAERSTYLDRACGNNRELRWEIEELLEHYQADDSFLERPVIDAAIRNMADSQSLFETQAESRAETLHDGDWMIGAYRIIGQIGKGGMGLVFLAEDPADGRQVAIKVMPKDSIDDEDRLARFNREARMLEELKGLKHPNIAEFYEQSEYDGKPCIVLEYVPGDTLAERLAQGALPVAETLHLAYQIADALQTAHRQRIVHRDLKPANIKITPEGQIKVLDFGLAKRFHADLAMAEDEDDDRRTRSLSLTESGMLVGTPAYMSPEQWDGREIDQRTDLWAFGCLLYEMLTGKQPFIRKTRVETMRAVLDDQPDWQALPKETPIMIEDLLRRCLQKEPGQRIEDAAEAQRMIDQSIDRHGSAWLLLKSWTWKIDRKTAVALALPVMILSLFGLWRYTPLSEYLLQAHPQIIQDDLSTILPGRLKGASPDLIRAALNPQNQTSIDLLGQDEAKSLRENEDNRKGIEEIIAALKSRIELQGGTAQVYAVLAQAHLFKFFLTRDSADKDEAIKAVRQARTFGGETGQILTAQGNVLLAVERFDEAIEVFEKARALDQNNPDVYLGLAMAHDFSGDAQQLAERYFLEAIEARKRRDGKPYWGDLNELAAYYYDRGRYDQASRYWREVIQINKFSPTGYNNLGNALFHQGCFAEALKTYNESIMSAGETVDAYVNLGAANYYLGNYREAIGNLEYVTAKYGSGAGSNLIEAWGNLGDAYLQTGRGHDALKAYEKALGSIGLYLTQFRDDYEMLALKSELLIKSRLLGKVSAEEDPIELVERTLSGENNCLNCLAKAVTVYHLAKNDGKALETAKRAVDGGYSAILLAQNPELAALRNQPAFYGMLKSLPLQCGK